MMIWLTIAATAASMAFIILLALGDPKRRRAASLPGKGHGTSTRRSHALGAAAPGLLLIFAGSAAAWLIWLGCCAVAGWLIALWFSSSPR